MDSLGAVAVKPIEFHIKAQIPFVDLAVPICYKLNEYQIHSENNYIPKYENRLFKLRSGAEDELTQIDAIIIRPNVAISAKSHTKSNQNVDKSNQMSATTHSTSSSSPLAKYETQIIDLTPSKQLSEPLDYSPMHIFVNLNLID